MQKQVFTTVTTPQATGDEPSIVISTTALDRDGDEIVPEGCELTAYRSNPVVLFGHDMSSLPVGSTTNIEIIPGRGIRARWRWLEDDDVARRVRNAYDQGVLRAASVGFLPTESERNARGGRRYLRWSLLEWSLCAVPSNPEAVRTLKSLGLDEAENAVVLRLAPDREDADRVVLRLSPDEPRFAIQRGDLLIQREDLLGALKEVLPALLGQEVVTAIRRELLRRQGRIVDDDLGRDPFEIGHHRVGRHELRERGW